MHPEKVKKIDPRVVRTKQLLSQSLRQLLGEQCFRDITVQDILDRATINRATFYAHFDDKDALLRSLLGNLFEQALHRHLAPNSAPCEQHFDLLVQSVCDFLGQVRRCTKLRTVQGNPHVEAAIKGPVHKVVSNWFAMQGRTSPDIDIAAAALSWALVDAAIRWSRSLDEAFVPADAFLARFKVLVAPMLDFLLHPSATPEASAPKPLSYPVYRDEAGMI